MEALMATDEDPPFKEWEQLNEKLKQVRAAQRRGKATSDDVRRIEEEYEREANRIDRNSNS
jgi:conjugal transfer/entry exclusion protein